MRERVLEQPAIPEAVAEPRFERRKLLRQRHDQPAADLLAMALDDADRFLGVVVAHRDAQLHRVDREWEESSGQSGAAHRLDAVAVEQCLDDARLDIRASTEDDDELRHKRWRRGPLPASLAK